MDRKLQPNVVTLDKKIMRFLHKGTRVTLRGIRPEVTRCSAISVGRLKGLLRRQAMTHCVQMLPRSLPSSPHVTDSAAVLAIAESETPVQIRQVLDQYQDVFREPTELPPKRACDHQITLMPRAQPVNVRPYRYAPTQKAEIEKQLTEMMKNGIKPSSSPYASPVLLVRKKNGSWHFCVDYRHLNTVIVKNKHPLPVVDELIDELTSARWFSKLDFRSGYHQICISEQDIHKTTFKIHSGLYEFLVMPFGLTNAPTTFQSVMNTIFAALLRRRVLVFMDDILIYSKTFEEHTALRTQVFEIIRQHQFFVKLSKCSFAQRQNEYLGHRISADGVTTEPSKIQVVQQWPVPKNLKELRGFLGLTGYYRKFIRHYGILSRPLTELLKKNVPFVWNAYPQEALLVKTCSSAGTSSCHT